MKSFNCRRPWFWHWATAACLGAAVSAQAAGELKDLQLVGLHRPKNTHRQLREKRNRHQGDYDVYDSK